VVTEVLIPPREARAVEVPAGATLTITDVEGKQVGDLISYVRADASEYLSTTHTIGILDRLKLRVGDRLYSNLRRPLWEIVRDDVGVHDLLFPACDPERYRSLGADEGHASCRVNLAQATSLPYNAIPNPLNVFMNTSVPTLDEIVMEEPLSVAGSSFGIRSLVDQVAAVSACPMDLNPCNGFRPSRLLLRVETA
jgi:uncharacterized protein YcgI (DUF1989 family)